MAKWVAANEMVMVRIKNPNASRIIVQQKEADFEPQGVVVSMGHKAIECLGDQFIDQTVRFTGQMQREVFGDMQEDEQLFVAIPYTAIVAVLQPEETDVATSH